MTARSEGGRGCVIPLLALRPTSTTCYSNITCILDLFATRQVIIVASEKCNSSYEQWAVLGHYLSRWQFLVQFFERFASIFSQHRALTVSRQASGISALSQWPPAGTLHSRPTPMREENTRGKVAFMLKMCEKGTGIEIDKTALQY